MRYELTDNEWAAIKSFLPDNLTRTPLAIIALFAGVWGRLMDALTAGHDAAVQMICVHCPRAPAQSLHRWQQ